MDERPDGSTATFIGWVLIAIGVLAAFFVAGAETPAGFWFSIGLANLAIGLGVLLLSLGYLVRAIWFLPGRDFAGQQPTDAPINQCAYCELVIREPALPCSAVPTAELVELADRIDDDRCRKILHDKGFLPE